jgi:hypothetical protein
MRKVFLISIMASLCIFISCASQPKLVETMIEPELAAPGDSIYLSIKFTGMHTDMKEVYLTVREYPDDFPMIKLLPKEKSDLNLWTNELVIPYDAYPGEYHLDINAFKNGGEEIITEGFENNSTGKTGTIIVKVK